MSPGWAAFCWTHVERTYEISDPLVSGTPEESSPHLTCTCVRYISPETEAPSESPRRTANAALMSKRCR